MSLKTYKPYTPSRRAMVGQDFSMITHDVPEKSLTIKLQQHCGRNNAGRITSRFRGGGHKKLYRIIDFKGRDKLSIEGKVTSIQYDPYRNARIALICYSDGEKRYVLARKSCVIGAVIMTGDKAKLTHGNRKQLKDIPDAFSIYNLEFTPQTKGKLVRTAGQFATITGRDDQKGYVYVKLPSGQIRMFHQNCWATLGTIGNEEFKNIVIGKAGKNRRLGIKPFQRGKSMNPVDHAHGGGEGRTGIGLRFPKSFAGKPVPYGKKTGSAKKWSKKYIISK